MFVEDKANVTIKLSVWASIKRGVAEFASCYFSPIGNKFSVK